MAKKKTAKTDKKTKAPLKATTAESKVQAAEKDSVNQTAEEIKAEPPKAVEDVIEALPQAKPAKAAQKKQPKDRKSTRLNSSHIH